MGSAFRASTSGMGSFHATQLINYDEWSKTCWVQVEANGGSQWVEGFENIMLMAVVCVPKRCSKASGQAASWIAFHKDPQPQGKPGVVYGSPARKKYAKGYVIFPWDVVMPGGGRGRYVESACSLGGTESDDKMAGDADDFLKIDPCKEYLVPLWGSKKGRRRTRKNECDK